MLTTLNYTEPTSRRLLQPPTDGSSGPPTDGSSGPPTDGSSGPPTDGSAPSGGDSSGGSVSSMDTMSGIAITGGAIFNGLAGGNVDAIESELDTMDACLAHASPTGQQHYHGLTPCAQSSASMTSSTVKPGYCYDTTVDCVSNGHVWSRQGWTDTSNYGGVFGIARDGHVIYGPYNASGELWGCDDHDVCNGFFLPDQSYAYAATATFPYIVGCWGPAPAQEYGLTCSNSSCSNSQYTYAAYTDATTSDASQGGSAASGTTTESTTTTTDDSSSSGALYALGVSAVALITAVLF